MRPLHSQLVDPRTTLVHDIVTTLLHWKCCAMNKWINIISYTGN